MRALLLALGLAGAHAAELKPPIDKANQVAIEVANLEDGSTGTIVVQLVPKWAPHGVERMKFMLKEKFYDGTLFYGNAKKDGYTQFGMSTCGLTANMKYSKTAEGPCIIPVPADHPRPHIPNAEGTLMFATANTAGSRCIELCFNSKDHTKELPNGNDVSIPIGKIIKGMDVLRKVRGYMKEDDFIAKNCDADGIIFANGGNYLKSNGCLPKLSVVKKFAMVGDHRQPEPSFPNCKRYEKKEKEEEEKKKKEKIAPPAPELPKAPEEAPPTEEEKGEKEKEEKEKKEKGQHEKKEKEQKDKEEKEEKRRKEMAKEEEKKKEMEERRKWEQEREAKKEALKEKEVEEEDEIVEEAHEVKAEEKLTEELEHDMTKLSLKPGRLQDTFIDDTKV